MVNENVVPLNNAPRYSSRFTKLSCKYLELGQVELIDMFCLFVVLPLQSSAGVALPSACVTNCLLCKCISHAV